MTAAPTPDPAPYGESAPDGDASEPVPAAARRGFVAALVLLALGAGLVLVASGQPWGTATVAEPGLPALAVTSSGREVAPAVAGAGVLALAGIAGLLATRRAGRVVVGLVLVAAGLGAVAGAVSFRGGASGALAAQLADRVGSTTGVEVVTTWWWAAAAAGGVLIAVAGFAAVVRGGRWPSMGGRYERSSSAPATARTPTDTWAALDRGEDPTL